MNSDKCKPRYLRIADKEAEIKLDNLIKFLESEDFSHFKMAEKVEANQKYIEITISVKMTMNDFQRNKKSSNIN